MECKLTVTLPMTGDAARKRGVDGQRERLGG